MIALLLSLMLAPPTLPSLPSGNVEAGVQPADPPPVTAPTPTPPAPGEVRHPARRPHHPTPLSAQALPMATDDELHGFETDEALLAGDAASSATPSSEPARSKGRPGDLPVAGEGTSSGGPQVVIRTATAEPEPPKLTFRRRPHPPERSAAFIFAYRQFAIRDALQRRQSWHFASLEVSPLRRYVRLNLITEFGWEGGEAAQNKDRADFMLLAKGGLGLQYPHWVTPFVEFQGGGGVARVEVFERNDLVFVYTLGVEAGAQWAVTRWLYLHAAVGWIRPVMRNPGRTVRYDRATFKVGFGF